MAHESENNLLGISVADEFAAIVMPLAAAAGFAVGVRFMVCYDTFGEVRRDISFHWNGRGTLCGDVFP